MVVFIEFERMSIYKPIENKIIWYFAIQTKLLKLVLFISNFSNSGCVITLEINNK